jgi:hypothetical protein
MVDARTKDGGSRKFFGTKIEAQTYARQCRTKKSILARRLSPTGSSLDTAGAFIGQLILLLNICEFMKSPSPLTKQWNSSSTRKAAGHSDRYYRDLRLRLGRFASAPTSDPATQE